MAERKRKGDRKRGREHRQRRAAQGKGGGSAPVEMPSRTAAEQAMFSMFAGGAPDEPTYQAQELAYGAMDAAEAGQAEAAIALAIRAVELDPDCVDALSIVAQAAARTRGELIKALEGVVARGAEALGPELFRDYAGHFWGMMETRPYMRARQQLAQLLGEAGRLDEAIAHYEDMLRLNPGDNQGVRYELLGHYLQANRLEDARRRLEEYSEDSAMFAWGRVLERFLAGDQASARTALDFARGCNRFAEAYLSGRKRMPRSRPPYYGIGDENEAVVCLEEIGPAWRAHPEAVEWLKEQERPETSDK